MIPIVSIERIEYALPKTKQTIEEVSKLSGISLDDLKEHLDFNEKHLASKNENALTLAEEAVYKIMKSCHILPDDINYIIFAYSGIYENGWIRSPAAKIQASINAKNAFCFEISNGCNVLNAALHIACKLLKNADSKKNILIVASDTLSKFIDFTRENIMHFYMYSDGAAALLVNNYGKNNQLIASSLCSDGRFASTSKIFYKTNLKDNTTVPVMVTTLPEESKTLLYQSLVSNYIKVISECINNHFLKPNDIKFLFLAQNSKPILSAVLNHFNYSTDKIMSIGKNYGHIGSIDSIIAFQKSLISGYLSPGDYIILSGTGVGFHWGAHLIQV